MKTKWKKYLDSIGISLLLQKRAEEVLKFYQQIYTDKVEDIFITEYLDEDGNRHYENMWLFSTTHAMEAEKFLQKDDFDCVPVTKLISRWCIEKTEYDFVKATAKSRMTVYFNGNNFEADLRASKENCDQLKIVFMKYIMPNTIG